MEHVIRSLDENSSQLQETLTATRRRIEELRPHVDKPFDHEDKLQALISRQYEIVKELDLTKNQASNQLSAEPVAVTEEAAEIENPAEENRAVVRMAA